MLSTKIASFSEILRQGSRFLLGSAIICYTLYISAKRKNVKNILHTMRPEHATRYNILG